MTTDDITARNYDAQMAHTGRRQTTTKKRYKKPEANVQAKVVDYLELLGFGVLRTNAGAIEIAPGRWFHGIKDGGADLHCNAWGMFLAVETKAPSKGLRKNQEEYRDDVESKGGTYIACHSVEELRAALAASYGPQRVAQWEADGRARQAAKRAQRDALMRKNGQKR